MLGGEAEAITARMKETYKPGATLSEALKVAAAALAGPDRTLAVAALETAVLDRTNRRRAFRRVEDDETDELLAVPSLEAALGEIVPGGAASVSEADAPPEEAAADDPATPDGPAD